jgi:hypothetical protein
MSVEELIEQLRALPPLWAVEVEIEEEKNAGWSTAVVSVERQEGQKLVFLQVALSIDRLAPSDSRPRSSANGETCRAVVDCRAGAAPNKSASGPAKAACGDTGRSE